jgi:hypothetical protein
VGDEAVRAGDQERGERRPHAALVDVGLGLLVDAGAGLLHGVLEEHEDLLRPPGLRGGVLDRGGVLLQLFVDDPHRERAGDLARGVASHPVGHDEERELLVDEVVVLVVVAEAADVGRCVKADVVGQAHRASERRRSGSGDR